MELLALRHGRTEWNANRRFQGHTDVPLDDEGRAQARALAALVRDERIDLAVSSDLVRAEETARIVLGEREIALRTDTDWREMRFGAWEGLTWEQIVAANPHLDPASASSPKTYSPAGGESYEELCERIARAVERCTADLDEDGVALIGTHAGPLHALLRVLLGEAGAGALNVRFAHGSLTRFRRERGIWTLARLNQTAVAAG